MSRIHNVLDAATATSWAPSRTSPSCLPRAAAGGRRARGPGETDNSPDPLSRYYAKSASHFLGEGADLRQQRRRWRHARRRFLWAASSSERVRKCGRVRLVGDTVVRVKDGVAHYAGITSCGSVHECPVCSAKIRMVRSAEIADAAGRWLEDPDHGLYMVTLTVPHDAGQSLDRLWRSMTLALQAVRSGRAWSGTPERFVAERPSKRGGMLPARYYPPRPGLADRLGVVATTTAKETTYGPNGWHPHLHLLVFTSNPASGDALFCLLSYLRRSWSREVARVGLGRPDPLHGVRVDICWSGADAGLYVAKCQDGRSVGNELARGDLKSAGAGHRTPFEILADLETYGLVADRDLWQEYEQVMRGKRALVWSRGYREILGMDPEQTDEDIAAADVGGQAVAVLSDETWRGLLAAGAVLVPWAGAKVPAFTAVLEAAERGGLTLVNDVLGVLGVPLAEPSALATGLEDCPEPGVHGTTSVQDPLFEVVA